MDVDYIMAVVETLKHLGQPHCVDRSKRLLFCNKASYVQALTLIFNFSVGLMNELANICVLVTEQTCKRNVFCYVGPLRRRINTDLKFLFIQG